MKKLIAPLTILIILIGCTFSIWAALGWSTLIKHTYINGIDIIYIDFQTYLSSLSDILYRWKNVFEDLFEIPELKFDLNPLHILISCLNILIFLINIVITPARILVLPLSIFMTLSGLNTDRNPLIITLNNLNNFMIPYCPYI